MCGESEPPSKLARLLPPKAATAAEPMAHAGSEASAAETPVQHMRDAFRRRCMTSDGVSLQNTKALGDHREKVWSKSRTVSDLTSLASLLLDKEGLKKYAAIRDNYMKWRKGGFKGAPCEVSEGRIPDRLVRFENENKAWRDRYRQWRLGYAIGAAGNPVHCRLVGAAAPDVINGTVAFDVVAGTDGQPALLPIGGPSCDELPISKMPPGALVTIRVFRFFESYEDEEFMWEQELRNVNSGSLLWLPIHLVPGMHSVAGAKYGKWFTVHYLRVYVKHFKSNYHMCTDCCSYNAKTFGSSSRITSTVSGRALEKGYFWYVSPDPTCSGGAGVPAEASELLRKEGWEHLGRAGPFDGEAFVKEWKQQGEPLEERALQGVLENVASKSESKMNI